MAFALYLEEGKGELYVGPNPFTKDLKIMGLEGSYVLISVMGERIKEGIIYNDVVLNLGDLDKGAYFFVVNGNVKRKIIKL